MPDSDESQEKRFEETCHRHFLALLWRKRVGFYPNAEMTTTRVVQCLSALGMDVTEEQLDSLAGEHPDGPVTLTTSQNGRLIESSTHWKASEVLWAIGMLQEMPKERLDEIVEKNRGMIRSTVNFEKEEPEPSNG